MFNGGYIRADRGLDGQQRGGDRRRAERDLVGQQREGRNTLGALAEREVERYCNFKGFLKKRTPQNW